MADLSVDQQGPNIDDLVNAVGDLSAPDTYIPPRSGTYRTSRFPGFYTAGQTPSNNPNPVAGDNPVALPPSGVDPNAPASEASGGGLSSITSNPVDGGFDPGEGKLQRDAAAEDNGRLTGYDTDSGDLLKAANLAASLTGPTGIAGLALGEGANALGLNPEGSAFDFKANANRKPGWTDAYGAALAGAHAQGLTGQPAANLAGQTANADLDYNGEGRPNPSDKTVGGNPTPETAGTTSAGVIVPSGVASKGGTGLSSEQKAAATQAGQDAYGTLTNNFYGGGKGGSGLSPSQTAAASQAGKDAYGSLTDHFYSGGSNSGKGGASGGSANGSNGSRGGEMGGGGSSYNKGGLVTQLKPHHKVAAHKNHQVMKQVAAKTGKTIPAIVAAHKGSTGEIGDRARLEAHVMKLACGGKVKKYAAGGPVTDDTAADPAQSDQYNPPAEQTQGTTDTVPAKLTPGEMVVTKPAASQYSPDVLAAMNDPQMAAEIDQLIEQFLSDQSDQGGQGSSDEDAADGGADDAEEGDAGSDDASGLGAMAPMRGIPSPKSKLASVTRAA